jgi:hypothetical protein
MPKKSRNLKLNVMFITQVKQVSYRFLRPLGTANWNFSTAVIKYVPLNFELLDFWDIIYRAELESWKQTTGAPIPNDAPKSATEETR